MAGLSVLGSEALSSGFNFLGNLGGSVGGGLFSINQAKKNRAFQERMYNKQVQDNIDFWKMQQDYNLPSAQLERLRNAGLSGLLMYGEGGISGNIAGQAPQAAQAPHGAQGQVSSFNTRIELANLALVQAQAKDLQASADLKKQEEKESKERQFGLSISNEVNFRTRDAQVAMANGNVKKLDHEIEWLATQDFALTNMTAANLDNIASMIEYRKKYYDIDNQRMLNDFWYQVESISIGRQHVSNEMKQIAVNWYNAKTNRERVDGELKVFAAQVGEINSRKDLNEQEKSNMILDAYNKVLKNTLLENTGTENLGSAAGLLLLLTGNISGRI